MAQPQEIRPNQAAELATGVGEGLYGVAKETARGVHAALTTDPRTTVDNAIRGIARTIDTAIAAEDTPARVQVSRAANAVVTASARDVGGAIGSTAANAALIVAPGAAAAKVSALRHARMARPRRTYKPARVGEAKETLVSDKPWKLYKDSAPGARPGYAPTLPRTMPDGSTRQVKFDGVEGGYMIDRKWSIVGWSSTKAQLLRQSEALAQQGLTSTLEVPDAIQKIKAIRLLKKSGITNIKVRIVKP